MTPIPTKRSIFTFTRRPVAAALLLALVSFAASAAPSPDPSAEALTKAAASLDRRDKFSADFWISRALGLRVRAGQTPARTPELDALVTRRRLEPAAFLSAVYDAGFLDWFESVTYARWGTEASRVKERYGSAEIVSVSDGAYFITVVAHPEIQTWFTASEGGTAAARPLLLALGSAQKGRSPVLFAGQVLRGGARVGFPPRRLDVGHHALHHLWEPELLDLDGDGMPEVWLRYNLAWGNGFTQVLDIYRLDPQKEPALLKRFQGTSEGVARRLGSRRVEVARGAASGARPHFEYDEHRFEVWEYAEGGFRMISERRTPHLLRTAAWKDFL